MAGVSDRTVDQPQHPAAAVARKSGPAEGKFATLMRRPGVLIRRLQQIQSTLFLEETIAFGVTPLQFSLMTLLVDHPGIEQGAAATKLQLDRFTAAGVVRRLEAARYLRTKQGTDRRAKTLYLTTRGLKAFDKLYEQAMRAHDRLLEPITPERRRLFMELLLELTESHGSIEGSSAIR